jgi:hypothetical protein
MTHPTPTTKRPLAIALASSAVLAILLLALPASANPTECPNGTSMGMTTPQECNPCDEPKGSAMMTGGGECNPCDQPSSHSVMTGGEPNDCNPCEKQDGPAVMTDGGEECNPCDEQRSSIQDCNPCDNGAKTADHVTQTCTNTTTTTTTEIPFFPSAAALAVGVGGAVLGTVFMLRRRL